MVIDLQNGDVMRCPACGSRRQAEFTAEINIHFRGIQNLDKPGVLLSSKLLVCLDCGCSQFSTPEKRTEAACQWCFERGTLDRQGQSQRDSAWEAKLRLRGHQRRPVLDGIEARNAGTDKPPALKNCVHGL